MNVCANKSWAYLRKEVLSSVIIPVKTIKQDCKLVAIFWVRFADKEDLLAWVDLGKQKISKKLSLVIDNILKKCIIDNVTNIITTKKGCY